MDVKIGEWLTKKTGGYLNYRFMVTSIYEETNTKRKVVVLKTSKGSKAVYYLHSLGHYFKENNKPTVTSIAGWK